MTFDEFMEKMLSVFPDAEAGQDNDGQLVIYTGLQIRWGQDGTPGTETIPAGEEIILPFVEGN